MKQAPKYFILLTGFSILFCLIAFTKYQVTQASNSHEHGQMSPDNQVVAGGALPQLETILITDLDQTDGLANGPKVWSDTDRTHVIWSEYVNMTEGFDLFYRQLPNGETRNLSDPDLTDGLYVVSLWNAHTSPDRNTAIIWREQTPEMDTDLFFWRESYSTSINLSDPDKLEGDVANLHNIFVDSNSDAYVLWTENKLSDSSSQELYLWDDVTKTRQTLSPQDAFGGPVNELQAKLENDELYTTWLEWVGPDEPSGPFFWDSISKQRHNLSAYTDSASNPRTLQLVVTPSDVGHVFWSDVNGSSDNFCPYHWDSVTKTTTNFITDPDDCRNATIQSTQDSNGQPHAIWTNEIPFNTYGLYYLDVNSSTQMTISETIKHSGGTFQLNPYHQNILVSPSGQANVLWIADPPTGSGTVLYYWNSIQQEIDILNNLTGHSGGETFLQKAHLDSTGNLHVFWENNNLYYWNSVDQAALLVNGGIEASILLDTNDIAHAIWQESGGLIYWNSNSAQTTLLPTPEPTTYINRSFAADQFGNIHIAYFGESGIDGEETNMYYWNGSGDPVDLSALGRAEGVTGFPTVSISDDDKVFVIWQESSDFFAAFEPVQLNNKAYLPMVVK